MVYLSIYIPCTNPQKRGWHREGAQTHHTHTTIHSPISTPLPPKGKKSVTAVLTRTRDYLPYCGHFLPCKSTDIPYPQQYHPHIQTHIQHQLTPTHTAPSSLLYSGTRKEDEGCPVSHAPNKQKKSGREFGQ